MFFVFVFLNKKVKLYNLLMVVKVNRTFDSSSSSRKNVGINWLTRETCQRLPTGISTSIPLMATHQQDWKDCLKTLSSARSEKNTMTGPDRRKWSLTRDSSALLSRNLAFGRKRSNFSLSAKSSSSWLCLP